MQPRLRTFSGDADVNLREPDVIDLVRVEELREHLRAPEVDLLDVGTVSRLFDSYCLSWHAAARTDRWNPDHLVSALGVCLGDILVTRSSSSRWAVVEHGLASTLAVRDDLFRRTIFPVDAVARRWLAAEVDWMRAFVAQTVSARQRSTLRSLEAEPVRSPRDRAGRRRGRERRA